MGLLTPCSVPRGGGGGFYTMIFPGRGFLLPSSRVRGGMVLDEIDTCIMAYKRSFLDYLWIINHAVLLSVDNKLCWTNKFKKYANYTVQR